ncbi:MAG: VWA domain-containing protein [Clostridia bacterium]|nr:VWA domain-containing protein [Clostridia bacterium]
MTNYALMFVNPLLLLLLIPALGFAVVPYFLVAKKYRRNRNRIVSLILHCTAITLAVFLLAGVSYSYDIPNKDNEIILLVDCSDSNESAVAKKDEFIENIVNLCADDYKLGIVKFGYDQLYVAKLSNDSQEVYRQYLESADPDTTATDVASALKYASTLFKNPTTSKIVLVSDGIETDGTAMSVIKSIAASGIRVDTAYYSNEAQDEIQIVGVKLPDYKIIPKTDSKIELDLKSNFGEEDGNPNKNYAVTIKIYDNGEECEEHFCLIKKGLQTVELMHEFDSLGAHNMKFEISNYDDTSKKNNSYHAFVKFDYLNRILLVERRSGESQKLQTLLTDSYSYDVTALGIDTDFESIPKTTKELCAYDQVILVNIANSDLPPEFDDVLYRYVNQFAGVLLTVGWEKEDMLD